jgi:5-methylcytosine-specific restriction enzyme A
MPKKRQSKEIWIQTRRRIWLRDKKYCVRCKISIGLDKCHIDHIKSGKLGTNEDSNLRTLCRPCHVLRADLRHKGMIAKALADGIIPSDWRQLVWDDND